MAFQSPLISIPKKTTSDADWAGPVRSLIAHSYGEDPKNYAEECSVLQRCRQDAVRGAGSDQTARDLLYKYFGQLELLELRFAEIKVSFAWNDAFTEKGTTQSSLAFEKASIIHLLSSVLSSLAGSSSRSDPEGLKRAYTNTRSAAGMLTYINDNFLHAPSTDLSREVVHFCIGIMTAQATEIFTEKLVDEKKSPALVARSANSAAGAYAALVEEMKDFQGKGVFDRNWLYVLQIKAKLFASVAQYYRALADMAGGKHGVALVRHRVADVAAQEAQRQASGFVYAFVATATPSLPSDAATSLNEITKAHATLVKEAKEQASRDNDLIYHDILPSETSLAAIEKLPAAQPITIQEIYQNPDVSKLIGPDIFARLVPLAVHESASVYSEEKAKLVRAEVERAELSEVEVRTGLEHLGLPGVLGQWRRLVEDDEAGEVELSSALRKLAEEVQRGAGVEGQMRRLQVERERCERELRELSGALDDESRECERARAKYAPHFTQSPSGPQTARFRQNISSNLGSLQAAASSDANVVELWNEIQPQVAVLSGGVAQLERQAQDVAVGRQPPKSDVAGPSLLDLQEDESSGSGSGLDEAEKGRIRAAVADAREKLDRLGRVRKERDEVLKDLKEKIQNDDVSNLLLMNRRQQNVDAQLFATELEKFRPYQSRIASAVSASQGIVSELEALVRGVERGKGMKDRSRAAKERGRRVRSWEEGLEQAGEAFQEVTQGVGRGMGFYESLQVVITELRGEVGAFTRDREGERGRLVRECEVRSRIGAGGGGPPPPKPTSPLHRAPAPGASVEERFASLSMGAHASAPQAPPRSSSSSAYAYPAPPPTVGTPTYPPAPPAQRSPSTSAAYYPPPPPRPAQSSSGSGYPAHSPPPLPALGGSSGSAYPAYAPHVPASAPAPPQSYAQHSHSAFPPPPPQPARQGSGQTGYPSHPPPLPTPSQYGYSSPPPQPQTHTPGGYQPYHPPSQSQPGYGAPPQQAPQQQGYPSYAPPQPQQGAYGYAAPPASAGPGQGQGQGQGYGGYQPPAQGQGGYGYGYQR